MDLLGLRNSMCSILLLMDLSSQQFKLLSKHVVMLGNTAWVRNVKFYIV